MLLKKLTEMHGVSGNEHMVREFIKEEIKPYVDSMKVDSLGNLIAIKNGNQKGPKIMIAAHMDEIGLMVKSIDDNGFIKFFTVGGIDDRILVSKVVEIGKNKINGIIGAKAIHLQEPEERKKALKHKQLYIDIGAKSKSEAEKVVSRGDYISFVSEYTEFGDGYIKAKALDDRVGCALLIELLKNEYDATICAAFTVQEEVGLRGATVAAYDIDPDFALVLEGTICHDITDIEAPDFVTRMGKGPALSIHDMATYYDKPLRNRLYDMAKENNIKIQWRQSAMGGNDSGKIHLTREGIPTAAISLPCRYIHSPVSVIHKDDYDHALKIVSLFLQNCNKEDAVNE